MIVYRRTIGCIRCGDFMSWTWAEGNHASNEFNAESLFKKLRAHQHLRRGHLLRFKEEKLT